MTEPLPLSVIGVVRSGYVTTEQTPIQASLNRAARATVEIAERYVDGLDGLAGFDYAWLITWLHRPSDRTPGPAPLRQVPFLLRPQQRAMGIFATRTAPRQSDRAQPHRADRSQGSDDSLCGCRRVRRHARAGRQAVCQAL
jgi:tRNA (Thr-GGU) A37 N-methylase